MGLWLPALALALSAAAGCSSYSTIKSAAVVDCSIASGYVFDPKPVPPGNAYTAVDPTPGAAITLKTPSTDLPCGATSALEIISSGNDDWGGLVGFYSFGTVGNYRDESAYSGLSFWARAPGSSNKSFTLAIDDANTASVAMDAGAICTSYGNDGSMASPGAPYMDPLTGQTIGGVSTAAPPPNACGNSYAIPMVVTGDWEFYVLPFTRFHQSAMPNRVPNAALADVGSDPGTAMLTDKLMNIIIRSAKQVTTDLWFANMTFYRGNRTGAGGDGGVD
jgi:hypothetical protein